MRSYSHLGLHGHVVRELGTRIVQGKIRPLETLDPELLGDEFGVSRTVVREALKVLSAKGLVGAKPRRGTFVRSRNEWSLLDPDVLRWQFEHDGEPAAAMLDNLAEVRLIIEPATAALAALRRTQSHLDALEESLGRMKQAEHDPGTITEADVAFHRVLLDATGNDLLMEMALVVDAGLHARNRYVHRHDVSLKPSQRAHRQVLDAVRNQDPEAARFAMDKLLQEASRDVTRLRRRVPPTGISPESAPPVG